MSWHPGPRGELTGVEKKNPNQRTHVVGGTRERDGPRRHILRNTRARTVCGSRGVALPDDSLGRPHARRVGGCLILK